MKKKYLYIAMASLLMMGCEKEEKTFENAGKKIDETIEQSREKIEEYKQKQEKQNTNKQKPQVQNDNNQRSRI